LDSTVNLGANTKDGYRSILRRYLRPAFGSYPLARIDALAVRTWLAKLEADRVGQATGPSLVDLERGIVTVAEQLLEVNGTFSLGPPKSTAGRPTLPAVVIQALADHLAHDTASHRRPTCSSAAKAGTCGPAASTGGSGRRPPGRPGRPPRPRPAPPPNFIWIEPSLST
jgi:hypothetical protein